MNHPIDFASADVVAAHTGESKFRRISNSEATSFLSCRRRYYYGFDLGLRKKAQGDALSLGILFHKCVELYYKALQEGRPWQAAAKTAEQPMIDAMRNANFDLELVTNCKRMWNFYTEITQGDAEWQVLKVEETSEIPLSADYSYVMQLDLLVRNKRTGKVHLVDTKTAYNFWNQDKLALNGQFPKYVAALQYAGQNVDSVIVNQVRKRSLKNPVAADLIRRDVVKPSVDKMRRALQEQLIVSKQITDWRDAPVETRAEMATRSFGQQCDYCPMKDLCLTEYEGGPIALMIQQDYVKNDDYGYNQTATSVDSLEGL